jgi:hypothetical protein
MGLKKGTAGQDERRRAVFEGDFMVSLSHS